MLNTLPNSLHSLVLDTANNYQNEESEMWIGEWMEQRGVRDQMVVATKVCISFEARIALNWTDV